MEVNFRRCIVDGQEALFHGWFEVRQMVSAGLTVVDDHPGGIISNVVGLIEYMDGRCERRYPYEIRFTDTKEFSTTELRVKSPENVFQKPEA